MTALRSFLACLALLSSLAPARAAEPFLKPNDVIALVGGEDMVAAAEYGYLELVLQRALPDYKLKVRSLAWEGDTVFEQPRDLNYPSLEAQLDEIGATVVIVQFGQMESLAGTSKLPEFIKAYEKLIERVSAGGKRRVGIVPPTIYAQSMAPFPGDIEKTMQQRRWLKDRLPPQQAYMNAIKKMAEGKGPYLDASYIGAIDTLVQRDGIHLNDAGHSYFGPDLARLVTEKASAVVPSQSDEALELAIRAKNRLWFHYYRPQNWAFLAGDRTEQPSSRDHKDPSKRWFPEEMKQWLPLIDAKEKEIWALAQKAAKP